jgi:hypothetical protein
MRHLDLHSFLALARCNRVCHAAASTDFACEFLCLEIEVAFDGSRPDPSHSRILRHCTTHVHWPCTHECFDAFCTRTDCSDAVYASIRSIPRIRVLSRADHLSRTMWHKVLSDVAFANVERILGFVESFGEIEVGSFRRGMPKLQEVEIECEGSCNVTSLVRMSHLRRLTIHVASEKTIFDDGEPVSLRSLTLANSLDGRSIETFLFGRMAQSLIHLSLVIYDERITVN